MPEQENISETKRVLALPQDSLKVEGGKALTDVAHDNSILMSPKESPQYNITLEGLNLNQDEKKLDEVAEKIYDAEHKWEAGDEIDITQTEIEKRFIKNPFMFPRIKTGKPIKKYNFPVKGKAGVVPYAHIIEIYSKLKDNRWKMLFLTLYLLGCRVSEALRIRRMDCKRGVDVQYGEYIEITVLTEKRQADVTSQLTRELRLFFNAEKPLCEDFWNYVNLFGPSEFIFPNIDRKVAWKYLKKIDFGPVRVVMRINNKNEYILKEKFLGYPHFLRHCRLTHLVGVFKFDMTTLVYWAGWSGVAMATTYVHPTSSEQGRGFLGNSGSVGSQPV